MAFSAILLGTMAGLSSSLIALLYLDFSFLASFGIYATCSAAFAGLILLYKSLPIAAKTASEASGNGAHT
jgi:hypothetical protein